MVCYISRLALNRLHIDEIASHLKNASFLLHQLSVSVLKMANIPPLIRIIEIDDAWHLSPIHSSWAHIAFVVYISMQKKIVCMDSFHLLIEFSFRCSSQKWAVKCLADIFWWHKKGSILRSINGINLPWFAHTVLAKFRFQSNSVSTLQRNVSNGHFPMKKFFEMCIFHARQNLWFFNSKTLYRILSKIASLHINVIHISPLNSHEMNK